MKTAPKIWIGILISIVTLTIIGCVVFARKTFRYQCKACLGVQCATYPYQSPTHTNAKQDARNRLCHELHEDFGPCSTLPEEKFSYECKEEQYWDFFPIIPPT